MKNIFLSFFLLTLLLLATGCGEGKSGVILRVTTQTPGIAPIQKPHLAVTGDDPNDTLPDRKLTPSSFTVAFTRFRLLEETDPDSDAPTPTHTIFDVGPADPIVVSFTSGQTKEVEETSREPRRGTYNLIEYEVRYFEMTIPLCEPNDDCESRRLRFYLTNEPDPLLNFTPVAGDILISRSVNGTNFSWIRPTVGLPLSLDLFPITQERPTDAYQVPLTVFPPGGITPVFRHALSPSLEIEENPDEVFIFTLQFDLADLFFFDNTDEGTLDTPPDVHFDALVNDLNVSRDGKIQLDCINLINCKADFWPGLPIVTVTVEQEERD